MKFTCLLYFIFLVLFYSCNDIEEKIDYEVDYCEEARIYIGDCIEATLPKLNSCDELFAKEVLNQNCENVVDFIFN
tara:strand:- start:158 stop:385 length:228 start_codon:yes stop_codon:yes gene_type:complete